MKNRFMVLIFMSNIVVVQASQEPQESNVQSQLAIEIENSNIKQSVVQAAYILGESYGLGRKKISDENLTEILRLTQASPVRGLDGIFVAGFNQGCRENSPTFQNLKKIMDSPYTSPEIYEQCERKMNLYLNK